MTLGKDLLRETENMMYGKSLKHKWDNGWEGVKDEELLSSGCLFMCTLAWIKGRRCVETGLNYLGCYLHSTITTLRFEIIPTIQE